MAANKPRKRWKAKNRKETTVYFTNEGLATLDRLTLHYRTRDGEMHVPSVSQLVDKGIRALAKEEGIAVQMPVSTEEKDPKNNP